MRMMNSPVRQRSRSTSRMTKTPPRRRWCPVKEMADHAERLDKAIPDFRADRGRFRAIGGDQGIRDRTIHRRGPVGWVMSQPIRELRVSPHCPARRNITIVAVEGAAVRGRMPGGCFGLGEDGEGRTG